MLHFLLENGIGQNITAGLLMGVPGFLLARRKLLKHLGDVHSKLDTLIEKEKKHNVTS